MRKINLVEMCVDFLAGGDAPADIRGKYHPAMVEKFLEAAYSDWINEIYLESKHFTDFSRLDSFCQVYDVDVTDLGDDKWECELPFAPMQLPDNMGIRQVFYVDDETSAFSYLENNADPVFSALEVNLIDTNPEFKVVREDNAHMLKLKNLADGTTQVSVRMIVPMEEMDDFDQVPIVAGKELALFDMVAERLSKKPHPEIINDSNPDQ